MRTPPPSPRRVVSCVSLFHGYAHIHPCLSLQCNSLTYSPINSFLQGWASPATTSCAWGPAPRSTSHAWASPPRGESICFWLVLLGLPGSMGWSVAVDLTDSSLHLFRSHKPPPNHHNHQHPSFCGPHGGTCIKAHGPEGEGMQGAGSGKTPCMFLNAFMDRRSVDRREWEGKRWRRLAHSAPCASRKQAKKLIPVSPALPPPFPYGYGCGCPPAASTTACWCGAPWASGISRST